MTAGTAQHQTGSAAEALASAAAMLGQRPDLALEQADEILRVIPGHPQAVLIAGAAMRRLGRLDHARKMLEDLAAKEPKSPATALELGRTAAALGDSKTALAELRRALKLRPEYPEALVALADALRLEGDDKGADEAYLRSIKASTQDPQLSQAAMAMIDGKYEVAEPLLKQRLRNQPTDVAALRLLGELALRIGREEDGLDLLRRTVELAPKFEAARELLARTLGHGHRISEALSYAEVLVQDAPQNPSHALFKASLLVRIGETEKAKNVYEGIIAYNNKLPHVWMSLGHVQKTLGNQAEAIKAYRNALEREPTLGECWFSLANLKTVKFTDDDVSAMQAALTQTKKDEDILHLQFALGKATEDARRDEEAFEHYKEGNRIRRTQITYSADDTHDQCERIAALFTPDFLAARAGQGCPSPDPIFVVGLPRSGSTLVEQILSSHSQIEGTMELPDMMSIAARLRKDEKEKGGRYPEMLAGLDADALRALGQEYMDRTRVQRHTSRPLFIDKMPNNWQHAGLIQLILPNAKIVDARRHPMACCFSAWKQHFARGQAFSYDLTDVGRYYRDYVMLMEAFDKASPGRIHRVIYERMVEDTENEVRRLLDYIGLPFEESCLEFYRNDRAVRTASSEQVRKPIFTDAVDHWRRFEPWLSELVEALGPVLPAYPEAPR
jgi:tetratricopeptide (TPR) repeat protein